MCVRQNLLIFPSFKNYEQCRSKVARTCAHCFSKCKFDPWSSSLNYAALILQINMTVNVEDVSRSVADLSLTPRGNNTTYDSIEEIKLNNSTTATPRHSTSSSTKSFVSSSSNGKDANKKSSSKFFKFTKKSSGSSSSKSTPEPGKSLGNRMMRKFIPNGNNQNNANAPVSRRKQKKSESSESKEFLPVTRSSSEPALNQPHQEAGFMKEAPSMTSLSAKKSGKRIFFRKKGRNSVLPSNSSSCSSSSSSSSRPNTNGPHAPKEPVFSVDVRTQNVRQVTPRQRQEIYALNRVMTRLENEHFKRFCNEKGFKGDLGAAEKGPVDYDIFM